MISEGIKTSDKAYTAGFIDGEGYIESVCRLKKNGRGVAYPTHTHRIEVCNTDFGILQRLHQTFGLGTLVERPPRVTVNGKLSKPQLMWNIRGSKAYELLKMILPYMKQQSKIITASKIIKYFDEKTKNS